mmetsp:Transcript_39553/g.77811  ORF Transcript_39553/g.77811 Transcript_39553/m.77811 type:complete len:120 (-) Transcript_39553:45-404(-)
MTEPQRFVFVPPAYGSGNSATIANEICCNNSTRDGANPECNGDCEKALVLWAQDCYNWALSDHKMVGLAPWHYDGAPMPGERFSPGVRFMPALLKAYQLIGREIVSGKQRHLNLSELVF